MRRRCSWKAPLDKESMERVVQFGCKGANSSCICTDLGSAKVNEINRRLHHGLGAKASSVPYLQHLVRRNAGNLVEKHAEGVRPWMAFFRIWSRLSRLVLLNRSGGLSGPLSDLGKRSSSWRLWRNRSPLLTKYRTSVFSDILTGSKNGRRMISNLSGASWRAMSTVFASVALHLPTRYESIIKDRDPVLFERMKPFLDEGRSAAFVGVGHIYGIRKMLLKEGYTLSQEAL